MTSWRDPSQMEDIGHDIIWFSRGSKNSSAINPAWLYIPPSMRRATLSPLAKRNWVCTFAISVHIYRELVASDASWTYSMMLDYCANRLIAIAIRNQCRKYEVKAINGTEESNTLANTRSKIQLAKPKPWFNHWVLKSNTRTITVTSEPRCAPHLI